MDIITGKIDVTKIQEARLFPGKAGAKYLDIVLIPTTNSKFGDTHMIVQGVTKEARDAGEKGPILGNAKMRGGSQPQQRNAPPAASSKPAPRSTNKPDDEIPF